MKRRLCSNCGSDKTTIGRGREYWYINHDHGGWLCSRCRYRKRHADGLLSSVEILKPDKDKLQSFMDGKLMDVINVVVDYYINNRLDKKTRKELLAKL